MRRKYKIKHKRRYREPKKNDFFNKLIYIVLFFILAALIIMFFMGRKNINIPIEDISAFKINYSDMKKIKEFSTQYNMDFPQMLTYYSLENKFFEQRADINAHIEENFILKYDSIKSKYKNKNIEQYSNILATIINEMKCFPVQAAEGVESEYIYGDSWGAERNFGGKRIHMGTDIMDRDNVPGHLKIVSMTDGIVENMGWNEKGGWRVGIRSAGGTYYYYAHLESFAQELSINKEIKAGEVIGLMGNSGYGKEGTTGMFETHLHLGISPSTELTEKEFWINPYVFLRLVEDLKTG